MFAPRRFVFMCRHAGNWKMRPSDRSLSACRDDKNSGPDSAHNPNSVGECIFKIVFVAARGGKGKHFFMSAAAGDNRKKGAAISVRNAFSANISLLSGFSSLFLSAEEFACLLGRRLDQTGCAL
jgi:hypothetical protein